MQPIHILQSAPQSSVTTLRLVTSGPLTSNPPNGYNVPSGGGAEGSSELRGTSRPCSRLRVSQAGAAGLGLLVWSKA